MSDNIKSRQFIFGFQKPLQAKRDKFEHEIREFISGWNAHGALIKSNYEIIEDQFLVITVSPESEKPSGCSIDSITGKVTDLAKSVEVNLFDENDIVYKAESEFISCDRINFKEKLRNGELNNETVVADFSQHERSDDERLSIIKKVSESWHARYL